MLQWQNPCDWILVILKERKETMKIQIDICALCMVNYRIKSDTIIFNNFVLSVTILVYFLGIGKHHLTPPPPTHTLFVSLQYLWLLDSSLLDNEIAWHDTGFFLFCLRCVYLNMFFYPGSQRNFREIWRICVIKSVFHHLLDWSSFFSFTKSCSMHY